jgi:transcriptional regulator with XRE-family HTH domain
MTEAQAKQLGRLVKRARKERKLSLRDVDERSSVSDHWLSRLERGLMKYPAANKLTDAARVLGIPPERIDQITRGQVSSSLPPIRTYFRAKYRLRTEQIQQIEEVFDRVRREHQDTEPDDHIEEEHED